MNKPVTLRISEEQIDYLDYLASFRTREVKGSVYTDLIRMAIENTFPIPKGFNRNSIDMTLASGVFHGGK